MPTKRERLEEFYRRLAAAPAARDLDEAFDMIKRIMTEVEDELSGVPEDPNPPLRSTNRLYPPKADRMYDVPGAPRVKRFGSRRHDTFMGENGAIDIRDLGGNVEFSKPGADGRRVSDL